MFDPTSTLLDAVHQPVQRVPPCPVHRHADGAGQADADFVRQIARHTGRQRRELHEVAVVERQFLSLPGVDGRL